MENFGSKSQSINFSNHSGAVWALPVCHKWPTYRKNPRTKWEVANQHLGYTYKAFFFFLMFSLYT